MNFNQLLDKLEVQELNLNPSPNDPQWLSHWDNENRVSISISCETHAKVMEEGLKIKTLDIQTEERTSSQSGKEYTSKRIVIYTPAKFTMGKLQE